MPGTPSADELMQQAFPLHREGRIAQAESLYERILAIDPGYADALYLLGEICGARGQVERAIGLTQAAIRSRTGEPAYHHALGELLSRSGRRSLAIPCFEAALALDPARADTWNLLGIAHEESARTSEAAGCFRRVLEIDPDNAAGLNNLGRALRNLGRAQEAIGAFRRLHELLPGDPETFGNLLFTLNLSAEMPAETIFREHLRFDALYGSGRFGRTTRAPRDPDPARRIRIGYVSPDFRAHAVSYFIEPVLRRHDKSQFELRCYHCHPDTDRVTADLKQLVPDWLDCADWTDDAIAERIIADGIDILVDLAGHTSWNRLLVFARRPAPIQVTWLGYLNTTGLAAMDYRITDRYADPPGVSDRLHSERLIRLPDSQWCYRRPDQDIEVAPLPALQSGRIRFGSFNKFSKLSPRVLALWAGVLRSLPGSSLLVAGVPGSELERLQDSFRREGISADRLSACDRVPLEEFRALHRDVDIAFDAHPYSGATTTCDSLWMGVPTLTLLGETSISRSSASLLSALGLDHWIARSDAEFTGLAIAHARDLAGLAALRSGLRQRMEGSPVMDAVRFTRNLESAYRAMWIELCAKATPAA